MLMTTEQREQIRSLIQITRQQIDFFESLDESIMSTLKMLFIVELNHIHEVLLSFQANLNSRISIQKRLSLLAAQLEKTIENRRIIQMNAIHFGQHMENKALLLNKLTTFFTPQTQTSHATLSLPSIMKNLAELSESMASLIKYHQYLEETSLKHRFILTAPDIILSFIFKNWSDFSESSPHFLEKMRFLQQMSEEALFLKKFDIAADILEHTLSIYSLIYATRNSVQHRSSHSYHEEIDKIAQVLTHAYKQTMQIDKLIDCLEKIQYIYSHGYLDKQNPIAIQHLAALTQCYFDNSQTLNEVNINKAIQHHQKLLEKYKTLHETISTQKLLLSIAHTHKQLAELYCLLESNENNKEVDKSEIIMHFQQALTYYQYYYYDEEKPIPVEILETLRKQGDFYRKNDQYDDAIKIYERYLNYTLNSSPQPHTEETLNNLGLSYFYRNSCPVDINQAIGCFDLVLERYKKKNSPALLQANTYYCLALAHQKSSRIDDQPLIQENLNNAWLMHVEHAGSASSGNYDNAVLVVLMSSALEYQKMNQLELARDRFITYKQIYTELGKNTSSFIYRKTLYTLGEIHQKLGDNDLAEKEFSEGLNIVKQGKNQKNITLFIDALIQIKKARKERLVLLHGNNKNTIFSVPANNHACNVLASLSHVI